MKKTLIKIVALLICALSTFAFVGCDEIENGSKIQRMTITLEFYDASGEVVDTTEVTAKLYTTYAPETTAHFIDLAEKGFYNGTCVSNVTSSFFEFGGYKYDGENFVENPYSGSLLKGEFEKNGWVGNKLTVSTGALIMKREYDDPKAGSKYDTAKGTVIVCTGAASNFSSDKYCVFGMILSDDGKEIEDSASDIALNDKSSLDKCKEVSEYRSEDNADEQTVTTLYHETSKKFYTKWQDGEGAHYCEGTEVNVSAEIVGEALENLEETLEDDKNAFLTVPYVKILIKSIAKAK